MVLTGIRPRAWGRLRYKGTPPFFLPRVPNISSIYGIVCLLCSYCVFPQEVSFCAPCPCYIFSWWRRPRASCGANGRFSIYMCSSCRASRSSSRLASRGGVLSWASRYLSSCRGLLAVSFRFCHCVLVVAGAGAMSSVERLVSVVSRHGRFALLRIALVVYLVVASRFVCSFRVLSRSSCRSHPFLSCFCRHSWREAGRVGRGGDVFVIMWLWRRCFAPVFLIGLVG